jgi:hypothetical protein
LRGRRRGRSKRTSTPQISPPDWDGLNDRLAALQFFEHGLHRGIAQIHAIRIREAHDSVESEDVDIGKRDAGGIERPVQICELLTSFGILVVILES